MSSPSDKREPANKTGVGEKKPGDPGADFDLSAEQADLVASCFKPAWEAGSAEPAASAVVPKQAPAPTPQPAEAKPVVATAAKAAEPAAKAAQLHPSKPQPSQPPTAAPAQGKAVRPDASPKASEPPTSAPRADTKADFKKTAAWSPKEPAKEEPAKPKLPSAQAHTQPLVLEQKQPAQSRPAAPREPMTTASESPASKMAEKKTGPVVVSGVVHVAGSPGTPPPAPKSEPPRAAEPAAVKTAIMAAAAAPAPAPAPATSTGEPPAEEKPAPQEPAGMKDVAAKPAEPSDVPVTKGPSIVIAHPSQREIPTDPGRHRSPMVDAEPISERIPRAPAATSPVKWVVIGSLGTAVAFAIAIFGMWMIMKGDAGKQGAITQPTSTPQPTQVATPVATQTAAVTATAAAAPTSSVTATATATATAKTPEPVKTSEKPPEPAKTAVAATTTTPPAKKAPETTPTATAKTPAAKTPPAKTGGGGIVRDTPF